MLMRRIDFAKSSACGASMSFTKYEPVASSAIRRACTSERSDPRSGTRMPTSASFPPRPRPRPARHGTARVRLADPARGRFTAGGRRRIPRGARTSRHRYRRPTPAERLGYDAPMFGLDTVVVLLIVLAVVLVWRGPKTLPKWGQTLGRGVKAARKEADELRRDAGDTDVAGDADETDGTNGAPKP